MRYWLIFTVLAALMPLSHAADSEFVAPSIALEKRDAQSSTLTQADPLQTKTIMGSPLTIRVGSDYAFQILNNSVPGVGQIYPSSSADTAHMGWFVQVGSASYSPQFKGYGAWTPGTTSAISGTGTSADPFRVTVTNGLPAQSLNSTQVVTYVNGENFFRKRFTLSNSGTVAISAKVFLGADIYLAGSDSGVPQLLNGAPGGKNCPGTTGNYNIMLIPQGSITPSAYSARNYLTVWSEISAGALSNIVDTVCQDNGAALQWDISIPAGGATTVEAATSFGDIPAIITCGTAHGQTLTETPTSGLCGTGSTASSVTPNTGAYNWSCTGSSGVIAQCLATRNYVITATADANGSITPSTQNVAYNATPSFTVTPSSGYKIQSVTGCSGSLAGNIYTAGPITAACSVSASFVPEASVAGCGASNNQTLTSAPTSDLCVSGLASAVTAGQTSYIWSCNTASCSATRHYAVNASSDGNGSISPNAAQNVAYNTTLSFAVSPNAGYAIQSVAGCSGSLSGNTYTTGPITAACSVSASFVALVVLVPVDGVCGSSQGQTLTNPPGDLCTLGYASGFSAGNTSYTWVCSGTDGGSTPFCSASRNYLVNTSAAANGSISPGAQSVAYNATPSFAVTPNNGYKVQSASGCSGALSGNTYTTGPITASCMVSASFVGVGACGASQGQTLTSPPASNLCAPTNSASTVASENTAYSWSCTGGNGGSIAHCSAPRSYLVSATASANGSISPGTQNVAYSATASFAVTPNPGYTIQSASGCSGALSGNTFTTGPVSSACAISVSFVGVGACGASQGQTLTSPPSSDLCEPSNSVSAVTPDNTSYAWSCTGAGGSSAASCSATRNYVVTPVSGANGSISPSSALNVAYNATPSFTVTPNAGYKIQSVAGCSGTLSGNTFTAGPVSSACAISVSFVGVGACGASQGQTLTSPPSSDLCEPSNSVSAVTPGNTSYAWSCTGAGGGSAASCSATRNYVLTPVPGANGSISPSSAQNVAYNATPSFVATANTGYKVLSVTGCSGSLSGSTYTTGPIIASCSIVASFLANVAPVATSLSLSGTAQVAQVLTASYAYSDADADPENTASSGSSYRFVRSTDNSMATTGDNVSLASGSTGGSSKTYTVQAADLGKVLFYCVTPKASTGTAVGIEVCSNEAGPVTRQLIAGECGSAISRTLSSPPLDTHDFAALCKIGTASKTGPQTWSCSGTDGGATTSCSSGVPLDGGLVGYWSFDGNANLASDAGADAQVLSSVSFDTVKSGAVLDGQASGGVSFDTGKIGKAAVFGGVDNPGQIKIANSSALQFTTGATFSVWVRFDGMKGMDNSGKPVLGTGFSEAMLAKNAVFSIGTNTANSGIFSDGGPYDMCFSLNGSPICSPAPGAALWQPMLEVGEWVHVVYVLSETDGVRQYVNGKLYSTTPSPFSFSTMNAEDIYLGNTKDARFPLLGALDELQIYNRALSEAEIGLLTNVDVVEFYHSSLDHYFITADANEAKAVDSGAAGAGWKRAGYQFKSVGSAAVCRFYGSMSPGPNSHFYTADANECAGLKQIQANTPSSEKRWNYESIAFAATLPAAGGVCPTGMLPIYRAYNNGFARGIDSNHRITSNLADIQQVVARGWIDEGVVMCASQ